MLLALQQNMLLAEAAELVEVPDVVGETQAAGTATLEGEGFGVAVQTAYSSTVPAGTIISQVPTGGSEAVSGSTVTITVSLGESAGGGISKRRRYFVQIDGQDFEVRDARHAQAVLQQAVDIAEQAAERQIAATRKKTRSGKIKQLAPAVPQIRTDAPIDLEPYQRAIEQAYQRVAQTAELRLLLEAQAKRDREDEEAAAMLLLH